MVVMDFDFCGKGFRSSDSTLAASCRDEQMAERSDLIYLCSSGSWFEGSDGD
jgi:hypothetical protein